MATPAEKKEAEKKEAEKKEAGKKTAALSEDKRREQKDEEGDVFVLHLQSAETGSSECLPKLQRREPSTGGKLERRQQLCQEIKTETERRGTRRIRPTSTKC